MTETIRDLGRKYESGSQKRKRKEQIETKSKEVESKCKKYVSSFLMYCKQAVSSSYIHLIFEL